MSYQHAYTFVVNVISCSKEFLARKFIALAVVMLSLSLSNIISAKDIPGASETSYGVSASGAFQFSIPIIVPQGVNGVQPNLSLSFSSSRSNGMAGVGWGVSGLGEISRCGRTFATDGIAGGVNHDENDRFCLNGQRLIVVSGEYGAAGSEYRTELDTFSRIVAFGSASVNVNDNNRAPSYFRVFRNDGSSEYYGWSQDSRFKLPDTNSIHSWKVDRVYDRNTNYYRVFYNTANGYPTEIRYALHNHGGVMDDKKVQFIYNDDDRPDTRFNYIAGRKIIMDKRLERIEVKQAGGIVRQYNLTYEEGNTSGRSRVTEVTEVGQNNQAMLPIKIVWESTTDGFVTGSNKDRAPRGLIEYYDYNAFNGSSTTYPRTKEINRGQWADMNGDGLLDLVIAYTKPNGTEFRETWIKTPTTSSGWTEMASYRLPDTLRSYENSVVNVNPARFKSGVINKGQLVDVNGDGLLDLVISYRLDRQRHQTKKASDSSSDIVSVRKTYINNSLNNRGWWLESNQYKAPDYIFDYLGTVFNGDSRETTRGRFVDIDGNGLVDWITAFQYPTQNSTSQRKTWLNTGAGWRQDNPYAPPSYFKAWRGTHSWDRGELVDVNGDGLLDWVEAYKSSFDGTKYNTWLNTGSGWRSDNSYNLPEPIFEHQSNLGFAVRRGSFIDLNGDGLRDWVRSFRAFGLNNNQQTTRLNTGKGWKWSADYRPPFIHQDYAYVGHTGNSGTDATGQSWPVSTRGFYVDVNRDGLVDFVQSYKNIDGVTNKTTWLNNGSGWGGALTSGPYKAPDLFFDYSGRGGAEANFGQFVDINSDTGPDWVKARQDLGGAGRLTKLNRVGSADWVDTITTTLGVVIKPTFLPLTDNDELYLKQPYALPFGSTPTLQPTGSLGPIPPEEDSRYIESPIYVVSELETSRADDNAGYNTMRYRYAGLQAHRKGRGSLGFKERFVTNVEKDIVNYTKYRQDFPFIGRPDSTGVMSGDDTLSAAVFEYNKGLTHNSGNKSHFIDEMTSHATNYELGSATIVSIQSQTSTYDDYGNVKTNHVQIKDKDGNSQSDIFTTNTYKPAANWLVSLLETSRVEASKDGSTGRRVTNAHNTYDSRGRLLETIREPNGNANLRLVTRYRYDNYGNLETQTQLSAGETRVDTFTYDVGNRLLKTSKNALNQVSTIQKYDTKCDQPMEVRDPNGLVTKFEYDDFCRQTKETTPDGVVSTTDYSVLIASNRVFLSTTTQTTGNPAVTVHYNKYAQATGSSTKDMLNKTILQSTEYDRYGRTSLESQPYFDGDTPLDTLYEYDVLDRVTKTTLPYLDDSGSAVTIDNRYGSDGLGRRFVRVTDTEDNVTWSYNNSLNQTVLIRDADFEPLRYVYDSHGNLTKTTDAKGNTIVVGYDILGRRTSLNDPDLGRSTFIYNAFGEMTSQTNANNQTLSMEYDKLGRLEKRTVQGTAVNSGGVSEWTYDTAAKGIGQLASVTGPNGYNKTYAYDNFSRLSRDTTTIKGEEYTQRYYYNNSGQLSSRRFPDSGSGKTFYAHYSYVNGYLQSITDRAPNASGVKKYWQAGRYDSLGRLERETLGDVAVTQRNYKDGQGVLEQIRTTHKNNSSNVLQNLRYTYDTANNMKTRKNQLRQITESFGYDNLYRLTSYSKGEQEPETTVRYDSIGNITYKSDVGTYHYPDSGSNSVRPHALTKVTAPLGTDPLDNFRVRWEWSNYGRINNVPGAANMHNDFKIHGKTFQYDANGNVKNSGNRKIYWTAFDKPHTIVAEQFDGKQFGSLIEYGPDFERIYKRETQFNAMGHIQSTKDQTVYAGNDYQRITDKDGEITHRYIIAAGSGSVQIDRADDTNVNDASYMLTDALGSTNVVVDAGGNVRQRLEFDPWGARLNVTNDRTRVNEFTDRGYTGHETDDESGLINMNARFYDPYLGRFLSADPVLPDAANMQAYNRYAYVINNPLRYTDPTGNEPSALGAFAFRFGIATLGNFIFGLGGSGQPQCQDGCINSHLPLGGGSGGGSAASVSGLGGFFFDFQIQEVDFDFVGVISSLIESSDGRRMASPVVSLGEGIFQSSSNFDSVNVVGRDAFALFVTRGISDLIIGDGRIGPGLDEGRGFVHIRDRHSAGASSEGQFRSTILNEFTTRVEFLGSFTTLLNSSRILSVTSNARGDGLMVDFRSPFTVGVASERGDNTFFSTNEFRAVIGPLPANVREQPGQFSLITVFPILETMREPLLRGANANTDFDDLFDL